MDSTQVSACLRAVVLAAAFLGGAALAAPAFGREANLHLCQIIPGEIVAEAVHGRLQESRAAEGRCIYMVGLPEGKGTAAFVIYHHDAGEYQGLRDAQEGELTKIDGLGDEAVLAFEPEGKRYWLLAVKRGMVALQVSGDDKEQVRQVGAVALEQFAGK